MGAGMLGLAGVASVAGIAAIAGALWGHARRRVRTLTGLLGQSAEKVAELKRQNRSLEGEIRSRTPAERERDGFFQLSLDLLAITDFSDRFQQLNPAWERVLGFPLAELKARPPLDLVHPEDRVATEAESQRLRMGGSSIDFENRWLGRDGAYRWLSWRAVPNVAEQRIYAVARDISERKKLDQIKSDFVSVVSHELRTPLTSIRGSLGLLAGGVSGELPEAARSLIDIAAKNSDRLVRLINDILDVEKVESGSMTFRFQVIDLVALLAQAVESNRSYAQPFSVRFAVDAQVSEARVRADADRLLQVLANLLSNAAKFSPRGGTVDIALSRQNGRVSVAVTDHGKGIPTDFQHRIFERFAQADATSTRQKGGTGLGLAISKAIVERHGGQIGFRTAAGQGTTFFFALPEWDSAAPPPGEPAARQRILVCEDDQDVALLLSMMLEREGYQVEISGSAHDAKSRLFAGGYAALTLDLALPDQDGFSLFRDLRADPRTCRLPVVVVSAWAEQGRIEWSGGAVGVLDWLGKPVDAARLSTAVHRAVSGEQREIARILHVEDDKDLLQVVSAIVGGEAEVVPASTLDLARRRLAAERFDLVILDLVLPDGSGLELLPFLGGLTPPTPVILFSAHEVGEGVSRQVASVLVKSQTSNRQLVETVQAALARREG